MSFLHSVTKDLSPYKNEKHLLAVSGGMDSMALLHTFLHFREFFGFEFAVAHFHHGLSGGQTQDSFRQRAQEFVKKQCEHFGVLFYTNSPTAEARKNSEADYRERRFDFLNQTATVYSMDKIVLAHHKEDLLETRLIRLIRGVGPEGLQAMSLVNENLLRPFLKISRADLKDFLLLKKAEWIDDPSNENPDILRNWLRQHWLVDLEKAAPGATQAMARSLDLLVNSRQDKNRTEMCIQNSELLLSEFLTLNLEEKRQIIATYMKSQGLKNYGLSHINEVLKRLDTEKKNHTFNLLGCCWSVDAGRMSIQGSR